MVVEADQDWERQKEEKRKEKANKKPIVLGYKPSDEEG